MAVTASDVKRLIQARLVQVAILFLYQYISTALVGNPSSHAGIVMERIQGAFQLELVTEPENPAEPCAPPAVHPSTHVWGIAAILFGLHAAYYQRAAHQLNLRKAEAERGLTRAEVNPLIDERLRPFRTRLYHLEGVAVSSVQ